MNREIIVSSTISGIISTISTFILWKLSESISPVILVGFFIVVLILIFALFRLPKWIKSKKLLLKILPKNKISVPVDGRELNIIAYNKNKNYDIDVKIKLDFPKFLEVFLTSNYNYISNELKDNISDEKLEKVEQRFEKEFKILAMNDYRITFKLLPKDYGKKGYIRYEVHSEFKSIKDKIEVCT